MRSISIGTAAVLCTAFAFAAGGTAAEEPEVVAAAETGEVNDPMPVSRGNSEYTVALVSSTGGSEFAGFTLELRRHNDSVVKLNRSCHRAYPGTRACRSAEIQGVIPPPVWPDTFVRVSTELNELKFKGRRITACMGEDGKPSFCAGDYPVACCAVSGDSSPRWVGYIDDGHDLTDGLLELSRACFGRFPQSRLCEAREFQESIPPPYGIPRTQLMMSPGGFLTSLFGHFVLSCLEASDPEPLSDCGQGPFALACCGP